MLTRLLTAAALAVCPLMAASPVVMISIDGLRPDYVTKADEHGLAIPTLRAFVSEGTYAAGVIGVLPTVTYPSHTTLVTGVAPARHGIFSNTTFDPELHNQVGWYWYAEDVRAPTLWDVASSAGLSTASVNWPVTVGRKSIRYNVPEYWRADPVEDRKLLRALSTPGLLDEMETVTGPFPVGSQSDVDSDAARARAAVWLLQTHRPRFLTVHLSALDHTEHAHAPFSKEAGDTLERLDKQVAAILSAARAADPATVVMVVSDHGFLRVDRRFNLLIPFLENKLIQLGPPADALSGLPSVPHWDATVWPTGGAAAIVLARPADEALAARVRTLLAGLKAKPENGIARVLERDQIAKLGGFPTASFMVEMQPGFEVGLAMQGPLITDAPSTGTHGYLADRPELRASFFVLGSGIAAHRDLGVIDMRQIAPTVAALLGVSLPAAEAGALELAASSKPAGR